MLGDKLRKTLTVFARLTVHAADFRQRLLAKSVWRNVEDVGRAKADSRWRGFVGVFVFGADPRSFVRTMGARITMPFSPFFTKRPLKLVPSRCQSPLRAMQLRFSVMR